MPPANVCSGVGQPLDKGAVGCEGFLVPNGRSDKRSRSNELALGSLCRENRLAHIIVDLDCKEN